MNNTLKIIFAILSTIGSLTIVIVLWELAFKPLLITNNNPIPNPTPTLSPSPTATPNPTTPGGTDVALEQRFSSGDRRLFTNQINPSANQGVEAFVAGNYEEAYQQFGQAVKTAPNDPEVQIYLNNSQARKAEKPFVLAAVVPVDQKPTNAEEMLRGVAQAQSQFNQQGINGRLLEIVIVNDSDAAQQVAQKIVNNNAILGVIGHNSSGASAEGLEEYEKAGIGMISPTSTSTSLGGNVFFRTVPSDAKAGEFLAKYARNNNIINAAVFYTSTSNYSQSLKAAFSKEFEALLGTIKAFDMSVPNFNSKNTVEALKNQLDAFVLFPNTDNKIINLSLQVADANANLTNPKKLLGGDALYNPATLKLSQGGVKDLVLAVPWFAKPTYPYTNLAAKRWGGRVSWRTATSYDATKAFTKVLSENATRNTVLTNLQKTELSPLETSGEPIQFLKSGDRRLFTNQINPSADQGVEAFAAGNYEEAYQQFGQAVKTAPNDPEVQIYLNNSQARKAEKPFVLAAVVPVDQKPTNAEEMLRGVAQAQSQFNQQGINGRLLEIVIVNDSDAAQQVAQKIVNNNDILGVIGHNSSGASAEGLEEYEKAGIAMISPTSTSTSLGGNVFFRTVPSDAKSGQFLAQYSLDNNISNVAIFFTSTSSYSHSLKQAFINEFQLLGTAIKFDISVPDFDPKNTVESLQDKVDAFVLFPNTDNKIINLALQVADANANLTNPKKLLGGDALYNPATLKLSQGGVEGLVLAVPWFAKPTYPYTNLAAKRWGGRVSWRTATSYDVTKAFIKALSENATRNTVLTNLQTTNLSPSETSGEPLQFLKSGDRNIDPLLVRVIRKSSNFAEYDFEIIND